MIEQTTQDQTKYTDQELIKDFPGFKSQYAIVNGIKIHYVEGGSGKPLICLPGWPQTWYSYRPIAIELAKSFRLIIVDLRGMGTSEKPLSGFDKKTMSTDVMELIKHLGLSKVNIIGHDIGGMVAMSLGFNFPEYVERMIVADGMHPNEGMMQMPLMPPAGTFTEKMDPNMPYAWWMGFNQVKELPEKILEGRFHYLIDWLFNYVMIDDSKMTSFERGVYSSAYNDSESIRASNAWYQSFSEDIDDSKAYRQLEMPVLGIASNVSYNFMKIALPYAATDSKLLGILDSGHYLFEECPKQVIEAVSEFLAP